MTDDELAQALIGTRHLPDCLAAVRALSREARAYHKLSPYPVYHFREWMSESRGPLPRCLPVMKSIVKRGAKWLFGKPLQIHVPENAALEQILRDAWVTNGMDSRLVAMAEDGALDGTVVLKFAYDGENKEKPLTFSKLSITEECRLYFSPHDCTKLLMARVQYSYFDAVAGKTMWYREEWTDAEEVHYVPVSLDEVTSAGSLKGSEPNPDAYEAWEVSSREPNPFGLIPLMPIKNIETDDVWGAADLWSVAEGNGLYRVADNINLTYHFMNQSNQFDSQITPVFIDGEMDNQDIDKPIQPAQPIELRSVDDGENSHQARVHELGGSNAMRPAMMEYAKDLRKQVLDAASSVQVDQAEFSNKGNLTSAVLEQLFQPQIEITNEKRKTWGDNGLVLFLALVARGLDALGVAGLGVTADPRTCAVALGWPSYFTLSQDELTALVTRTQTEEVAGYLTHERAIERVAQANGIVDIKQLKSELPEEAPVPAVSPNATTADSKTSEKLAGKDGT